MTDLKNQLQKQYSSLISQANQAYIESHKPKIMSAGLSSYYLGRAEAFEEAAEDLRSWCLTENMWLQPKQTMRQHDVEQARQEKIFADEKD